MNKSKVLTEITAEAQKLRNALPAAANKTEMIEEMGVGETQKIVPVREKWVMDVSKLAAISLHNCGAVPEYLAWGSPIGVIDALFE